MRIIKIESDKLKKILEDRQVIFDNIGEINKVIVAKDKERTAEGYKMDKLKEKTADILKKQNLDLEEFEDIGAVKLVKGEIVLEIFDYVEEYKKQLRDERAKKAK